MNSASLVTSVVFDLSEVLLHGLLAVQSALSRRMGLRAQELVLEIPDLQRLFEGSLTEAEYWAAWLKCHQSDLTVIEAQQLVRAAFGEIPGTRSIVARLKRAGYTLGLLSVHAREWTEYCERVFRYQDLFDAVCYSYQIGLCKPDKRAFHWILGQLSVEPSHALLIDDRRENIEAAAQLGMNTLQFSTAEQLSRDLARIGLRLPRPGFSLGAER